MSQHKIPQTGRHTNKTGRNVFEKTFEIIRELRIMRMPNNDMRTFYLKGTPGMEFSVGQQPVDFMQHFFKPVTQALDYIFNWRKHQVRQAFMLSVLALAPPCLPAPLRDTKWAATCKCRAGRAD